MKKYKFKNFLLLMLFATCIANANTLIEKYPSYSYVFSEFDVDESYIYNESFEKYVLENEKKIKDFYNKTTYRGDYLLPMVKNYLIDDGLSDLLIYISMIESGLNTDIVSRKNAVGLWQFMKATAKDYKLSANEYFDERYDPVTSTKAAIEHLRRLHKKFGKWYLAIMAYNCGEGRLLKAINKAGSDELQVLISNEDKYLPRETRDYIRKILLISMIGESDMLDFSVSSPNSDMGVYEVEVSSSTKLKDLATLLNMDFSNLCKLNKQYKNGIVPKSKNRYKIMIPEDKMFTFYMKYEDKFSSPKNKIVKPNFISHNVVLGDTIENLAKKYNSSIEEIMLANNLKENFLTLDTLILIPVSKELFEKILSE
ncbi:Membrane-bound lytic murein transglycosylase D precursor [hydrothermal vent metagenome]|uniref:Membrane-bound lytic murein transglycosylase D n=1 Tax=hydrothermal vent metagenome TaxID=652676 RepID=A0A1W1ECJ9_9ZZZZ